MFFTNSIGHTYILEDYTLPSNYNLSFIQQIFIVNVKAEVRSLALVLH